LVISDCSPKAAWSLQTWDSTKLKKVKILYKKFIFLIVEHQLSTCKVRIVRNLMSDFIRNEKVKQYTSSARSFLGIFFTTSGG